jgi:hypothetical protein
VRRSDQHQPALFLGQVRERRRQQAQLADALLAGEQLGERGARPTCARQLSIERGESRGHALDDDLRVLVAAPDGGMLEDEVEGGGHAAAVQRRRGLPPSAWTEDGGVGSRIG